MPDCLFNSSNASFVTQYFYLFSMLAPWCKAKWRLLLQFSPFPANTPSFSHSILSFVWKKTSEFTCSPCTKANIYFQSISSQRRMVCSLLNLTLLLALEYKALSIYLERKLYWKYHEDSPHNFIQGIKHLFSYKKHLSYDEDYFYIVLNNLYQLWVRLVRCLSSSMDVTVSGSSPKSLSNDRGNINKWGKHSAPKPWHMHAGLFCSGE